MDWQTPGDTLDTLAALGHGALLTVYPEDKPHRYSVRAASGARAYAGDDLNELVEQVAAPLLEKTEKRKSASAEEGVVYFFRVAETDYYCLGVADDWEQRLRLLQRHNPLLGAYVHLSAADPSRDLATLREELADYRLYREDGSASDYFKLAPLDLGRAVSYLTEPIA